MCSKENEFKSILFSLVYFHAVVVERRKFGPQGWNRSYPYNTGDLTISVNVLYNYLEANNKVYINVAEFLIFGYPLLLYSTSYAYVNMVEILLFFYLSLWRDFPILLSLNYPHPRQKAIKKCGNGVLWRLPWAFFYSSWLNNVEGMKDMWYSNTVWLLSIQICMGGSVVL